MSFSVALQPIARRNAENASLQDLVRRINEERGAFRNITEEQLKEEIVKDSAQQRDDIHVVEEEDAPQDLETRRKEVYAARHEILQFIGYAGNDEHRLPVLTIRRQAQNEALTALDFVSLLLTKEVPRADSSLSPFLKTTVPKGTLDFDRSDASRPTKLQEEKSKTIAAGWSLSSLNASADKLLGAAQRLEKEMEKETKYWNQILSVTEKGWSTRRMPREPHTVGVWFGFSEAGSLYSSRGLAALRPDASGDIMLDQGLSSSARAIQLQLIENGQTVERSQLAALQSGNEDLEEVIRHSRDSLFDEELFHEMTREARTLASQGIVVRDETIRIPINKTHMSTSDGPVLPHQEVVIGLVSSSQHDNTMVKNTRGADAIALVLRLLLTDVYRQRFQRRTQKSQPLTDEIVPVPTYDILQPTINYLNHKSCTDVLVEKITIVQRLLHLAGLSTSHTASRFELDLLTHEPLSGARTSLLVEHLKAPLRSIVSFSLSSKSQYEIIVKSHMSAPTYGSTFALRSADSSDSSAFHSVVDLERHIMVLARKAVLEHIVDHMPNSRMEDFARQIILPSSSARTARRVEVSLQKGRLALIERDSFGSATLLAVWHADGDTLGKTVVEFVKESMEEAM